MRNSISISLKIFLIFLFLTSSLLSISCRQAILESKLEPENKEFYSKVRYIISEEEKKIFLELLPSERENFITDFWKRRDPTPDTEENEFKREYLNKIETANRLFMGGGKPGYIQDRGRVYILLGPPDESYLNPVGKFSAMKAAEIWLYYKKYQIRFVFIDHNGDGEYTLERPTTWALHELNMAQMELQNPEKFREELFDFKLKIEKAHDEKFILFIEIPYENIWLVQKENRLETTFGVLLEVFDSDGDRIWQFGKDFDISLTEEEAKTFVGKDYEIKIPLDLEGGSYSATIVLDNKTEERELKKEFDLNIPK